VDPLTISAYGALGIIAIGIGAFFRFGPGKTLGAIADALFGTPTTRDRSGEVMEEGRPGLVHRVASVEEAVVEFRHVVGLLTETQKRIDLLENRVAIVEEARIEKLINQLESAQMWRAVADRDVIEEGEQP
jgi:hypothetical protein